MKFHVIIKGDFHNIKGLSIAQKYFIDVQCGTCNKIHRNTIYISEDMKKTIKVKEIVGKYEKYNLTVECKDCKNVMAINVFEPDNKINITNEETEEVFTVSPVIENAYCHISTLQSDSAIIKDVDGLILDAIDLKNHAFPNLEFSGRILAEDDMKGDTIDIQNFRIEVEQV